MATLTGMWAVQDATLPNGTFAYTGTITIAQHTEAYSLDWQISAGRYVGVGLFHAGHLYVACGEQHAGLGLALLRPGQPIRWCESAFPEQIGSGEFAPPLSVDYAGQHDVIWRLPDGRVYGEWTLIIEPAGEVFRLTWRREEQIHAAGLGLPMADGLAVAWYPDVAQLALLDYTLNPAEPDTVTGVWALGAFTSLGTEMLERIAN